MPEVAGSSPAQPAFVCATICSMIERLNVGSPYTPNCFTMASESPYTLKWQGRVLGKATVGRRISPMAPTEPRVPAKEVKFIGVGGVNLPTPTGFGGSPPAT
jgi:hypothetical protein